MNRPTMKKYGAIGALLFAGLLAIELGANTTVQASTQTYSVTDLGTLAGDSKSVALGLNDGGQAVGDSSNPTAAIATLFSDGKAVSLGSLGGNVSIATSINSVGQIVGRSTVLTDSTFHAFLYSNGVMTDIHSAAMFPSGTYAFGINKSGQLVGQGLVTSSTFHAFLYSGGQMHDLGTLPGGSQASANAINDSGQVVGSSDEKIVVSTTVEDVSRAFLYANGKMTDLGAPAGDSSNATAISSNGLIAGTLYFSGGAHGAVYSNGVWTDLGGFPGSSATHGTGVNAAGIVVGTAFFPQISYHPPKPGKHVALIAINGALVDLNTLIPSTSGFTLTDALGINGSGQIICDATNSSGSTHAVLLTPK
jgi:probable HAF family extracellular repeat protein